MADPEAMVRWFIRRRGSVEVLYCDWRLQKLPASLLAVVALSQSTSLRVLSMHGMRAGVGSTEIAALVACSRLETLSIVGCCGAEAPEGESAALMRLVSRLPALRCVLILRNGMEYGPCVAELAAASSNTLRRTQLGMAPSGPGSAVLLLAGLPALLTCNLRWAWGASADGALDVTAATLRGVPGMTSLTLARKAGLYIAPHSFSGVAALQGLTLETERLCLSSSVLEEPLRQLKVKARLGLDLQPGCFDRAEALAQVTLDGCRFTEVPPALRSIWGSLQFLNLDCNQEMQLTSESFGGFSALAELSMQFCNLQAQPSVVWPALSSSLKRLDLQGNAGLRVDASGLGRLTMLTKLELSLCGLPEIPTGVLPSSLRALSLAYNAGIALGASTFSGLLALEALDLSMCCGTAFPEAALASVGCTLGYLNLSRNEQLTFQPHCFSSLRALHTLNLAASLPAGVPQALYDVEIMASLRRLDLRENGGHYGLARDD